MTTILILCAVGIAAILAELVLPGGVLGIIGGLCLVGAVAVTFATFGTTAGVAASIALVLSGLIAFVEWMRWFHRLPFTRDLVLHQTSGSKEAGQINLVGRTGSALTDLLPSGRVEVDGEKFDAIAEGPSIPKGSTVLVTGVSGPSLVVRVPTP